MPDKIHYQQFDSLGRVQKTFVNNDANENTGKTMTVTIDGKQVALKGVDTIETYKYDVNGRHSQIDRDLNADEKAEEIVYIRRDEHGREKGRYIDLDNNANTGTGNKDQGNVITLENDGRTLKGVDSFETYEYNENGQRIQANKNLDAKDTFETVEYYDVDKATGQVKGIYYNLDNDHKEGALLEKKTGETISLDNRRLEGIDKYTTYKRDSLNRIIEESENLDAKGDIDRVYYYDLDANGNRIGVYENLDNDTALKLGGKKQITGTKHTLKDGREVEGIERYYEQEFDGNNRLIKRTSNLDGKDHAEGVSYYEYDVIGREIARYDNLDNDRLRGGVEKKTGHDHTITLDGKQVTVTGIDNIVKNEHDEYGNVLKSFTNNTGEAGDKNFTIVNENTYNERRQKTKDVSKVKLENGDWVQAYANEYTYDIYGRTATRKSDTDSKKAGFESKETYHYNNLDQLERVDTATTGQNDKIDGYTLYEKDRFGNTLKLETHNADNSLSSKVEHKFDQYGYVTQRDTYSSKGELTIVHKYEQRDERGYVVKELSDKGKIGERDAGDAIFEYTRDAFNTVLTRKNTRFDNKGASSETNEVWGYDALGRRVSTLVDKNGDGKISQGESNQKISFYGESNLVNVVETYSGEEYRGKYKIVYDDLNMAQVRFFARKDNAYYRFDYDGNHTPRNYTDDLTKWSDEFHQEIGKKINTINLSGSKANTEITLDKSTLAKLSSEVKPSKALGEQKDSIVFTINGDATDTVNLKGKSEFNKLPGKVQGGNNEFEKYTTEVEGQTYTLVIDTDVHVVLA